MGSFMSVWFEAQDIEKVFTDLAPQVKSQSGLVVSKDEGDGVEGE